MSGQWRHWQGRNYGKKTQSAQNAKGAGKAKKDGRQDVANAFPPYDGGTASASSMPSTSDAIPTEQVLGILQKYAGKDKDLAEEVQALLPQDVAEREELKSQQKHLNQLRKLQGRIYKKEQQVKDKEAQMAKFITDMKRHIEQEKARHKQETEGIQKEIQELREQLQRVKEGKTDETEEADMDLEEMLDGPDQEKDQLRQRLEKSEKEKQQMQTQLQQIQQQMYEFMAHYNPAAREGSPNTVKHPDMANTPDQVVKTPQTLPLAAHLENPATRRRDALQPFGGARNSVKTPSGPYAPIPPEYKEKPKDKQEFNLESPDH